MSDSTESVCPLSVQMTNCRPFGTRAFPLQIWRLRWCRRGWPQGRATRRVCKTPSRSDDAADDPVCANPKGRFKRRRRYSWSGTALM